MGKRPTSSGRDSEDSTDLKPNMSDTEAMDISPIGSTAGDIGIPGIDKVTETSNPIPIGPEERASPPVEGASNMKVDAPTSQLKFGVRPRDDIPGQIDPNERPLKRARTMDSQTEPNAEGNTNDENDTSLVSGLTSDQQAHCERVLNSICRLPAAGPFLEPVDPIQAKAPDYYEVITQPMDLGTIDRKLKSRGGVKRISPPYTDLQEFVDDVNQVFDNCFKYNGSTHAVSQLAIRVKDAFEEGMKTAPGGQDLKFIPITVAAISSHDSSFSPGVRQMSQSMSDLALKAPSPPAPPPAPRRRNTAAARSVPPTTINVRSRRDPLRIAQEKFCKATLDHLYRAEFETWALPFLGPVDLNAYPEYLTLIKQPMDFGTISDKLSHGEYATAEDFQTDVKLVFSNCYAFNPTWAPVYDCAKKLEEVFDEKWKELPLTVPETAPLKQKRPSGGSAALTRTQGPKSTGPRQHSKKRPALTSLNEEQRFSLCETLSTLPDQKMDQVIALIRKRMPQFRDNKEELDLTIENIPEAVQAEMFELLKRPKERKEDFKRDRATSDSSSFSSFGSDDANSSDGSEKGM